MSTSGRLGMKGIKPSGNEITLPPGSTTVADHCVIPSRDVIRPRRGQGPLSILIDNDAADANSNRPKEMYQWGDDLLVSYTGNSGYRLSSFSDVINSATYANVGSYTPPDPTVMRMKFAQLAKSVYWTTDAGLATLDVVGGTARAAGLRRPTIYNIDPDANIGTRLSGNPSATGTWFAKNQTVAGRAVMGKKDANGIPHLSQASGRVVVVNPNDVTVAIGGLVRNANVVTATVTAHKFRVGDVLDLTVSGGDAGNFDTTSNVVTVVTATTIVWAETAANYTNVASVTITSGTKSIQWSVKMPADIAAGDFLQIYRTEEAAGEALDPGDECFLAYERTITSTDISNGYAIITDTTPASFLGDPLDSNANTAEGVLGENVRPPLCRDLCVWDQRLWGGQTTDRHRLRLRVLGTGSPNGLQTGDIVAINCRAYRVDSEFSAYTAYLPVENVAKTTYFLSVVVDALSATTGLSAFQEFDGDTGLGEVFAEQVVAASTMADGASGAISAIYAATSRTAAFADRLASTKAITAANTSRTSNVVTVRCASHGFAQGQVIMLAYAYGAGAVDANFAPGLKTIATITDANNFTYAETGSNATLGAGTPYYAYATTYKSDDNKQPLRFSRAGIPEAWPLANTPDGLPDGAEVLRIKPTPDGGELLVCLKDGDLYALSGQYPYSVRRVDGSAQLVAADSLVEHANQLYGFTTQGPATIGSSGVGLVGLDIEDEWRELLYGIFINTISLSEIWGLSHESDRQYQLWMPVTAAPATRAYVYHSMAAQWTRWPSLSRTCGLVFRGLDQLLLGSGSSNAIHAERRAFGSTLYTSFADGVKTTTANGTQTSVSSITVASTGTALAAGDLIKISSTFYRVTAATTTSITIDGTASVTNGQTITYYRSFTPVVTFAVEAAGMPGIEKQFRELQLHFARRNFDDLTVSFTSEHSDSSSAPVTVSPSDFVLNTPINRPTTVRVEVPLAMRQSAMLTISISTTEAHSFFDLLGYSVTHEPISERTGK